MFVCSSACALPGWVRRTGSISAAGGMPWLGFDGAREVRARSACMVHSSVGRRRGRRTSHTLASPQEKNGAEIAARSWDIDSLVFIEPLQRGVETVCLYALCVGNE